ncbi:MAG: polymer-forming cytoskeletal protein [Ignavibacteriaceae bacterium]|nr:polymer-forming cytoskeletal protein [Ignavibacteriaceae bacterium]
MISESVDEVTIISSGVVIEGKVSSNGNIRVDGKIQGNIKAKGSITIGETGEITGEVQAELIVIGGTVNASVQAKEKLTLESKSILKGDIITRILVIEAGARFEGNSKMTESVFNQDSSTLQS